MKEIIHLIKKDFILEWRQKYALNGMILYVISTVFVCYISFKLKVSSIEKITWNTLFWIILLFSAVNSITKSFIQEKAGRQIYYFTLANPQSVIISKIIYNIGLMLFLGFLGFVVYFALMGNQAENVPMFLLSIVLGALGFSSSLTLIAGIASKADNSSGLMAVLSFPVILPILTMLIRLSKNAMDGLAFSSSYDEIITLMGIDLIVIALSYVLFPYLWKS
ncbi:ABC transporter permease [Emticicia sp. CRIBPO]|uniref:heme exporter protein CcmB n=1 Tax=Emticicia sp. CRIBPO TaxID=2683258 RepID=UPI00141279DE|nr:heme exporter protein CcmB [Emticicia sp. CRIBPO]NBA88763.1 ABC transporter permease [Emticicia sp. CRIBPO]